jgi:hypothetical protein
MNPFNTASVENPPAAVPTPTSKPNSVVGSWAFNTVNSNYVTPDATGNNPAVLASVGENYSYTPLIVPGKVGEALSFTGNAFAYVPVSASILTPEEITISAWVNIQSIKGVPYNNIFIEAVRTTAKLPLRTMGVAINGEASENASSPPLGAIRAYVVTQNGVLNEIITKNSFPLDTWIYIVFTRSLGSGMHIYVNGQEQQVEVISGVANPTGPIQTPTDIYIGHDSITEIENLQISNTVEPQTQPLWMQWWPWVIISVCLGSGLILFYRKKIQLTANRSNVK